MAFFYKKIMTTPGTISEPQPFMLSFRLIVGRRCKASRMEQLRNMLCAEISHSFLQTHFLSTLLCRLICTDLHLAGSFALWHQLDLANPSQGNWAQQGLPKTTAPKLPPSSSLNVSPFVLWVHAQWLSRVWLFATLWTVVCQTPLTMQFSRQEYWSGLPCPPPGDLPDQGIKPWSLTSLALAGGFFTTSATWE